jgi:hypothetical protein
VTKALELADFCDSIREFPSYAGLHSDLERIAKELRLQNTKIKNLSQQLEAASGGSNAALIAVVRFALYHHQGHASSLGCAARKALGINYGRFLSSEQIREMHEEVEKLKWPGEEVAGRVKNE